MQLKQRLHVYTKSGMAEAAPRVETRPAYNGCAVETIMTRKSYHGALVCVFDLCLTCSTVCPSHSTSVVQDVGKGGSDGVWGLLYCRQKYVYTLQH